MNISKHFLNLPDINLCYHQYVKPDEPDNTMLLLHGAGVAGQLTWHHICRLMRGYRRMIVPDLRGSGETLCVGAEEKTFELEDIRADLNALLQYLNVQQPIDLAGYSFGGACVLDLIASSRIKVGRVLLIEPALLERADFEETLAIREQYSIATNLMRQPGSEYTGIEHFVNQVMAVSQKNAATKNTMYERLSHRVKGLANQLDALTRYMHRCHRGDIYPSSERVLLLNGANSHREMLLFHHQLKEEQGWQVSSVTGVDHSLIFQKPRKIAELFSEHLLHC